VTHRKYPTPEAFKQALEHHLRSRSTMGVARHRQLLVFDRFLARVAHVLGDAVTLKGGLVLELRLERARTTKDVDLRMTGSPTKVLERLQEASRLNFHDYMTFEVRPDTERPGIQNDGTKYDGLRFRAECKLAAKLYGSPFGVDVAFGDPIFGEPEEVVGEELLLFAGIEPTRYRIYPIETHIAEKLHAYTMPRERPNSRVKDLPDLALLATTTRVLDAARVYQALAQTFSFRGTHPVPRSLPSPPLAWQGPYEALAKEDELPWPTLAELEAVVRSFLDPILGGNLSGTWDRTSWSWNQS
jgi:hypothetical protein